ncbi:MAG: hypothetical protein KAT91_00530 [Candidatus Aenigmarchaeota archaeon]|nr:hypothetical protein [Candidatus Aenigmarchaeota archaeon]
MQKIFSIFLIVLVLGCTNGTSLGGNGGVSVGLSVNPVSIRDTQQSLLTISLKNTGDEDTTTTIDIYGIDNAEWDYDTPPRVELIATDKQIGYTAEEKKISFFLERKENKGLLPKGQVFTFEPRVRVCYNYKTIATSKIDVYSKEEFYREMPQERSISTKQTKAPLQVSIDSKQPLISGDALLLDVTLTNTGGGTVTNNECGADKFSSLNTVKSFVIEVNGDECTTNKENIILKKGQSTQITIECGEITTENPKETKNIELKLKYTYYTDAKTTLLVEGTSKIVEEPEEPTKKSIDHIFEGDNIISCDYEEEETIEGVLVLEDVFDESMTIYVSYTNKENEDVSDMWGMDETIHLLGDIELKLLDISTVDVEAEIQIICP